MKHAWALPALAVCALFGGAAFLANDGWLRRCDTRNVPIGASRDSVLKICGPASAEWDRGGRYYKFADSGASSDPVVHWMAWRGISNNDVVTLKNDRVDYTSSY